MSGREYLLEKLEKIRITFADVVNESCRKTFAK